MFKVNIHTEEQLQPDELVLLLTIARATAQRNDVLANTDIYRNTYEMGDDGYPRLDENGNQIAHKETLSKEKFVDIVKKGMTGTLTLSVTTEEGETLSHETSLLPVALVDIPLSPTASLFPLETMQYNAIITPEGLSFGFCGDLLEFARKDKDWKDRERPLE